MKRKNPRVIYLETAKSLIRKECCNFQEHGPNRKPFYCWAAKEKQCVYFLENTDRCQLFEKCVLPLAGPNRTQIEGALNNRKGDYQVEVNFGLCLYGHGYAENGSAAI